MWEIWLIVTISAIWIQTYHDQNRAPQLALSAFSVLRYGEILDLENNTDQLNWSGNLNTSSSTCGISLAAPNVICSQFNCQMKPVVPKAIAQVPQLLHVGWRDSEKWLSATSVDLLGSKVFWLLTFVSLYSDPSSDQPNLCYSSFVFVYESFFEHLVQWWDW